MHRHTLLILITVLGALVLLSATQAAGQDDAPSDPQPILVEPDPNAPPLFGPVGPLWQEEVPVELEEVPPPYFTENHAADHCGDAPDLNLRADLTGNVHNAGDIAIVNNMTSDPSDPVLSCMWGRPVNPRGWRTVWYKFVAPVSGHLIVNTSFQASVFQDSYDTVLALYHSGDGSCGTLSMMNCDDDTNGFFSEINAFIIEGRTYYIEVADRSFSVQGEATLRLSVVLAEGESLWQRFTGNEYSDPAARTRHAIVSDGRFIYLIGGEVRDAGGNATRIGDLDRFDAQTRTWKRSGGGSDELKPLPIHYYSRTSAALVAGHIYVPSGYVGNNQAYEGTHWIYNIEQNVWVIGPRAPWAGASDSGAPYAWHQAVASPPENGYYLTGGLLSGDPSDLIAPIDIVPTGSLLFYDARRSVWSVLQEMGTPRYAHVAARVGGQICVAGGVTRLDRAPGDDLAAVASSMECYNSATQQWTTRASMNFPRFGAGSAVAPDGKWYVFGGINSLLQNVTLTEVYDPARNTWTVLDSRFSVRRPGRAWALGAFANNGLWIFGGEEIPGNEVIPLVERLAAPGIGGGPWIPAAFHTSGAPLEPNDTMAQAMRIGLGQEVRHTFDHFEDYFDFFSFVVTSRDEYLATLTDIPGERDYDVYVYNHEKEMVGHSINVGELPEGACTFTLDPGTYYVLVMRAFGEPFGSPYRLVVNATGEGSCHD